MADGADDTTEGAELPRRIRKTHVAGGIGLLVVGWAHARIFDLERRASAAEVKLSAVETAQVNQSKAVDTAIAELKAASAEGRATTADLKVQLARLEAITDRRRR